MPASRRRLPLPRRIARMDETVARRINARRSGAGADGFWRLLSAAANHGVLWFAAAGVLFAIGRPRAALRGLASLGLASLAANVVGKNLVGGERPAIATIPIARRLERTPTSPSFPSGHTASAVAFATGAGLESPAAGAALAPLAAAVGYSRLHTGAHWFSDVVGGAVIGAAGALALKAVTPPPTRQRPRQEPTASTVRLPTSDTGAGLYVLVNPGSGAGLGRPDAAALLADRLPAAEVHVLRDGDDIATLIHEQLAAAAPPIALGVCGGDGSVGAVAHEARLAGLPLLVLPGGTFNHFAKAAALGSHDAALAAFAAGTGRAVDVAELAFATGERRTALNTSSVGIYPAFVAERERHEARWGKPLAALIAAVRVVRRSEPVEVVVDGRARRIWSVFVGVDRYYPVTVAPIERRRLDDGLLDVRILGAGRTPRTRGAVALAFGGRADALVARLPFLQGPPVVDGFTSTRTTLRMPAADLGFAHDGEAVARTPGGELRITILPEALRVYSPAIAG